MIEVTSFIPQELTMITDEERVALEWVIALLQPREGSPDRGETFGIRNAKILQGLLEKLVK